jgi:hypothetical protein
MSVAPVARFELVERDIARILHGFAVREEMIGLLCNAPTRDAEHRGGQRRDARADHGVRHH